jgi:hypothetical protein
MSFFGARVIKPGHASETAISIPASPNFHRILYFWTTSLKFGVWGCFILALPNPVRMRE